MFGTPIRRRAMVTSVLRQGHRRPTRYSGMRTSKPSAVKVLPHELWPHRPFRCVERTFASYVSGRMKPGAVVSDQCVEHPATIAVDRAVHTGDPVPAKRCSGPRPLVELYTRSRDPTARMRPMMRTPFATLRSMISRCRRRTCASGFVAVGHRPAVAMRGRSQTESHADGSAASPGRAGLAILEHRQHVAVGLKSGADSCLVAGRATALPPIATSSAVSRRSAKLAALDSGPCFLPPLADVYFVAA